MSSNGRPTERPAADGALLGLARELEQVNRQVRELRGLSGRVDELAATLAELADTVANTGHPARESAPCWLGHPIDAGSDPAGSSAARDAAQLLEQLASWVANVYLRYADSVRSLPDCWMRHPDVVEELLWLHRAWLAAYDRRAPATAVGEWHDRQRPGVVARIRATVGMCSLDAHRPGGDQHASRPDRQAADAVEVIAAWWITARDDPAPTPTEQQLTVALARYRPARR